MMKSSQIIAISVCFGLAACSTKKSPTAPSPPTDVERSAKFYETLPTFQQPLALNQAVPTGLADISAKSCGACHTEIYKEWKVSTHARAWEDDSQFMAELHKSRTNDGDVGWMCVNCHTPIGNQLPELVVGLKDGALNAPIYVKNPEFDPALQLEAITCATCHVRDGVILGPRGDSPLAPHPVRKEPNLSNEATCTRCHEAQAVFPENNLGCFFDTGTQYAASPAAAQGDTCQTCHMPTVERPIAIQAGAPVRTTRRHWFGGSLIPKKPEYEAEIAPLRKVFGSGVEISVTTREGQCKDTPDCVPANVTVLNSRAGHSVPTGDPERHVIVEILVKDGDNVLQTQNMEFGSRYEWWPKIKLKSDTRLPAGEERTLPLEVPTGATIEIVAHKYRMYEEAFEHHELEGKSVRGREFHRSKWAVTGGQVQRVELVDDLSGGN